MAPWIGGLLVLAVALTCYLPGLGATVVQREQELRVALTARAMAEGGSWLAPTYLGSPRYRKPPLQYWLVASAYRAGGATDSAFLARLPSATAGAALAFLTWLLARSWMSGRGALVAGLSCATCFILLKQSRLAETDVPLALWSALAAWGGYRVLFEGKDLRWMLLAGLASGLGFLTKGPAALALPVAAWIAFAVSARARPTPRTWGSLACWITLAALIALPWYAWLLSRADTLAQLQAELSATFGEETQHPGPWFYYIYTFLHAFAPWSLLLPPALWLAWREGRTTPGLRFAWLWFVTGFVILSATSSKQIHYTTLLVVPASLLVGWYVPLLSERLRWSRQTFSRALASALLVLLLLHLLTSTVIMPRQEKRQLIRDLALAHRESIRASREFFLVGRHRATLEFHAGRPVRDMDSLREAFRHAQPGDLVFLNTRGAELADPGTRFERIEERTRGDFRCALWRVRGL